MSKNSTLELLGNLLHEEENLYFNSLNKSIPIRDVKPRKETLDAIIAYARSVKAVRMNSEDVILISLN